MVGVDYFFWVGGCVRGEREGDGGIFVGDVGWDEVWLVFWVGGVVEDEVFEDCFVKGVGEDVFCCVGVLIVLVISFYGRWESVGGL